MTLKDLHRLIIQIKGIVNAVDLSLRYDELVAYLNNLQSNPNMDYVQSVITTMSNIQGAHATIETELSTLPHVEYLRNSTDMDEILGLSAYENLSAVWLREQMFSQQSIAQIKERYSNFMNMLDDTQRSLRNFTDSNEEPEVPIISFTLSGENTSNTVDDLNRRLKEINSIMHGFARLSGDKKVFAPMQIRSISKSSPTIIDLASAVIEVGKIYSTELHLFFVARSITWILNRMEQVQNIRLKKEELKQIKFSNSKVDEGLTEVIDAQFGEKAIDEFIDELVADSDLMNPDKGDELGSDAEIRKALKDSVKKLITLHQRGGSAKVYFPPNKNINPEDESTLDVDVIKQNAIQQAKTIQLIEQHKDQMRLLGSGTE